MGPKRGLGHDGLPMFLVGRLVVTDRYQAADPDRPAANRLGHVRHDRMESETSRNGTIAVTGFSSREPGLDSCSFPAQHRHLRHTCARAGGRTAPVCSTSHVTSDPAVGISVVLLSADKKTIKSITRPSRAMSRHLITHFDNSIVRHALSPWTAKAERRGARSGHTNARLSIISYIDDFKLMMIPFTCRHFPSSCCLRSAPTSAGKRPCDGDGMNGHSPLHGRWNYLKV